MPDAIDDKSNGEYPCAELTLSASVVSVISTNVCTDDMAHMEESNETDVEDEAFSLSAFVV